MMTLTELHEKLKKAGWKPFSWRTTPKEDLPPTLSNILETFPETGWIHLVRSPLNSYKWQCKYEPLTYNDSTNMYTEMWGDSAEEAAGELWILRKEKGLITITE